MGKINLHFIDDKFEGTMFVYYVDFTKENEQKTIAIALFK